MATADLDRCFLFSTGIVERDIMALLLLIFFEETLAQNRVVQMYELSSHTISFDCTKAMWLDAISEVGCAVVASRMPIYNFGFVFLNETCMICRARGTPGDPTRLEIIISGKPHVDGEVFGRHAHAYTIFKAYWISTNNPTIIHASVSKAIIDSNNSLLWNQRQAII